MLQNLDAIVDVLLKQYNATRIARDLVRYDLLQPDRTQSGGRGQAAYSIAGVNICKHGLCRVLGMGSGSAKRIKAGKSDARFGKRTMGDPRNCKSSIRSSIYGYLWNIYINVAECMPDQGLLVHDNPFEDTPVELQRSIQAFRRVVQPSGCLPAGETVLGTSNDMPVKSLPPGRPKDYFWTWLSSLTPTERGPWHAHRHYSTFRSVWRDCFSNILRFRPFGTHATCSTCAGLLAAMARAPNMDAKITAAERHREHLTRQWRDRLLYWRVRDSAKQEESDWLVMMADGADQAKFRILKAARWPSSFEALHRPKLQIIGCMIHGHECSFPVREENMEKGSDVSIEVIARCVSTPESP